ncbi:MAG: DUF1127 domain-containing protein [Rhodospirillales bacterium]|jgi:uncharacterized protein YjiS (DUF1127 family)|tara:strand:+ start:78 stop:311 length:234 start_codon:yes stop_codon:yes gene_type:complete
MSIILKQAKKFTCAKFISKYFKFLKEEINTALARHRTYRQVINELNMCFDREMSGIGIARTDIVLLAKNASCHPERR